MDTARPVTLSESDKNAFLSDALQESFRNVRHYQELAHKAATVGTTGAIAFLVWLIKTAPTFEKWEKRGLALFVVAFTL